VHIRVRASFGVCTTRIPTSSGRSRTATLHFSSRSQINTQDKQRVCPPNFPNNFGRDRKKIGASLDQPGCRCYSRVVAGYTVPPAGESGGNGTRVRVIILEQQSVERTTCVRRLDPTQARLDSTHPTCSGGQPREVGSCL